MARGASKNNENGNKGQLGIEADLFLSANKLRKNLEPSDYKHVVLGIIFLKYISDAFEALHTKLAKDDPKDAEDPDQYLAERVFWVPKDARWSHLQANAKQPTIGKLIDEAMLAIEAKNPQIKGVLPKDYARPALDKVMLGELIDLVSNIGLGEEADRSKDILGRVYEYFLSQFAGAEGKRGGEFYTPRSVVSLLVGMLEPYKGRVYDPCSVTNPPGSRTSATRQPITQNRKVAAKKAEVDQIHVRNCSIEVPDPGPSVGSRCVPYA